MKKYRNWLLLAMVMAIVIAACGGGDGEGATTTAGETATTGEGAAAGDTGYEHLDQAMAGEFEGTTVEIVAQWVEGEVGELQRRPRPLP